MFRFRYSILEIDELPREKNLLRGIIYDARKSAWRKNIARWIAINLIVWSLIIMFIYPQFRSTPKQTMPSNSVYVVYLPIVIRSNE